MPGKKFQRRVENFACLHCSRDVPGDGYTNHCPHCLWSLHVDISPGDRAAECRGKMRPLRVEPYKGSYRIEHRCESCGFRRYNKMQKQDDYSVLLALARHNAHEGKG